MVHPRGRDKQVAVIEAYFDESGIHDDASHCVVAGFIGSARNWQRFEANWLKASGEVEFHGKRFFARHSGKRVSPYRGWSNTRARQYLVHIVDSITTSQLRPLGIVIEVAAFNRLPLTARRVLTGAAYRPAARKFTTSGAPSKPFFVGFADCLAMASEQTTKPGWKVNIVWDRQNEFAGYATTVFQTALRLGTGEGTNKLGELVFKDKSGVAGLQAADLLAHAAYKRADIDVGVHEELDMATARLRPMTHKKIRRYDAEGLRMRLERMDPVLQALWAQEG